MAKKGTVLLRRAEVEPSLKKRGELIAEALAWATKMGQINIVRKAKKAQAENALNRMREKRSLSHDNS
jgi:hypothetical protein